MEIDFGTRPFTAIFIFDTTPRGTLQDNGPGTHYLNGLIGAGIDLGDKGRAGWSYEAYGGGYLTWSDDLSSVTAQAGLENYHLAVSTDHGLRNWLYNGFQFGVCPGANLEPCGLITEIDSVTITDNGVPLGIPGPVVGAGLPGILALLALILGRRRRSDRRHGLAD